MSNIKELYDLGYDPINDQDKRRNILRRAVVIYGPTDLIKKLNMIYKKNKNINNNIYITVCSDKKWISNNYIKTKPKHKIKKSIRSKRSKRKK